MRKPKRKTSGKKSTKGSKMFYETHDSTSVSHTEEDSTAAEDQSSLF